MRTRSCGSSLRLADAFPAAARGIFGPLFPLLDRALGLDRLRRLYEDASNGGDAESLLERALDLLRIRYEVETGELDWIPRTGPVLLTANHPFGLLEGLLLASLLSRVRPDFRILANSVLAAIPELSGMCIFADPFGGRSSVSSNASALKECLAWLGRGRLLAAFPAGEVAHAPWPGSRAQESPWNPAVARLAQHTGATVVPLHFAGSNSALFHAAGWIHPRLRTLRLPGELFNKAGRRTAIRIGRPVAAATLRACPDAQTAVEHLKRRDDLLAAPTAKACASLHREPIAEAIAPELLACDIARLAPERKLAENGDFAVWIGSAAELPNVLREIGRLREEAFRQAGEGSGHSRDLDRFDRHYQHLVLWNARAREVAGAYRLAATEDILKQCGVDGLYTSTLFRYDRRLFERMGPAIELGRSFVAPKYQKQYAPLLLLWRGIVRYAASRPECSLLFGAASISNAYCTASRDMLVGMLETRRVTDLALFVKARNPYRGPAKTGVTDPDAVGKLVADLEPDGKGIPILLKQYWKAGAKVLGFNIDHAFSNSLDALVMVDLRESGAAVVRRRGMLDLNAPPPELAATAAGDGSGVDGRP